VVIAYHIYPHFSCSTHLQDLKDVTEEFHYENYRARYIQSSDNNNVILKPSPDRHSSKVTAQLLEEKDQEVIE